MLSATEQNKETVKRFNKEIIENGNFDAFYDLVSAQCINHTAPPGADNGPEGMVYFLKNILRSAFSNIAVAIHDQVAEGDKVCSRKTITGLHSGDFMGVPATNTEVAIEVTDIIRLQHGKYADHWGMSNIPGVLAELRAR